MRTCPGGRRTANRSDKPSPQAYKVSSALASQDVLNKCLASVGINDIQIIQILIVIHSSFYIIFHYIRSLHYLPSLITTLLLSSSFLVCNKTPQPDVAAHNQYNPD